MAGYADLATIRGMLEIPASDTSHDARFDQLNEVASRQLDAVAGLRAGSAFGVAEADLSRTFTPLGTSDVLYLTPPIRSVTSVTVDGQALTEGTDYRLIYQNGAFASGLYRTAGSLSGWGAVINRSDAWPVAWAGVVVVTGQWADQPGAGDTLDPVLVEAANVLVVGYYRKDSAADGEVSGPEGLTFRPSNPWNDQRVRKFIEQYARTGVPV